MPEHAMYSILIVDDNKNNLFTLRTLLESHLDADIIEAESGLIALEKISERKIDLILLDIQMPDMDGFEVAELIRKRQRYRDIPIIFLTAIYKSEDFKQRGLQGGAIDYLTKPIDDAILINRVTAYLRLLEGERSTNRKLQQMNAQLQQEIEERRRAEKALHEQSLFLQKLIDTIPNPVFYKDAAGKYIGCNKAYEDYFKLSKSQLIGKSVHDLNLISPDAGHTHEQIDQELFQHQGAHLYESAVKHADETVRDVIFNKASFQNLDGTIGGLVGVIVDITERKRMEMQFRKLSSAIEQSPSIAVITDLQGNIEYVNPQFTKMTGYRSEDVLGQSLRVLRSGEHPAEFYRQLWETIFSGQEWRGEICNRKRSGELYWEAAAITSIRNVDGEITHFLKVAEDITARKKIEEELERLNQQLRDASQHKSDFLAQMSHELRTPLNAVIGYTSLSLNDLKQSISPEQLSNLAKAERSSRALLKLINDVLDFSKIEAGQMEIFLEEIDLTDIIDEIVITAEGLVSEKPVELKSDVSTNLPLIHSDYTKVKQVLNNLLGNAMKFTAAGSITVRATPNEEATAVLLDVEDTGTGIPEDKLGSVFESFKQAETSTTRKFGGTGLGLAISKRFCDMLGIRIEVKSQIGKGTTFSMQIPTQFQSDALADHQVTEMAKHQTSAAMSASTSSLPKNYQSVLVIDDDEINLLLMSDIFQHAGYTVYKAQNGLDGIKIAQQIAPDVIITDLSMPEMDGFELTRRLMRDPKTAGSIVIACTALATQEIQQKSYDAGCKGLLRRPVEPERLLEYIRTIVAASKA